MHMVVFGFKFGALTSKVSAYRYRSWELEKKETLDFSDSFGQIGLACVKGLSIMRIIPYSLSFFDWISDKFRFSFDSLLNNRNIRCFYYQEEVSIIESFIILRDNLFKTRFESIDFFLGKCLNLFDITYLHKFSLLFKKASYYFDSLINKTLSFVDDRFFTYVDLSNLTSFKTLCLLGIDLRIELPVLESFLVKKLKFEVLWSVGMVNSAFTTLGLNIIKLFSSILNGIFLGVKKMLISPTLLVSSSVTFVYICEMLKFISRFDLVLDKVVLKVKLIKQYLSDVNIAEYGVYRKNIGGHVLLNSLVFLVDTTEIVINKYNNFIVSFSAHTLFINKSVDLSFPILLPQEVNSIFFTLQGSLVYCEKLLKKVSGVLSVANYFKLFIYFFKYSVLGISTMLNLIKMFGNFSLFLLIHKPLLTVVNTVMISRYINDIVAFKSKFYSNLNLIYRAVVANYYYTHNFLINSPTILLADARLFNKNINFVI